MMNSRPFLFVAALALSTVNALIVTGAIVTTVYTWKVTRFTAGEMFDYATTPTTNAARAKDATAAAANVRVRHVVAPVRAARAVPIVSRGGATAHRRVRR